MFGQDMRLNMFDQSMRLKVIIEQCLRLQVMHVTVRLKLIRGDLSLEDWLNCISGSSTCTVFSLQSMHQALSR